MYFNSFNFGTATSKRFWDLFIIVYCIKVTYESTNSMVFISSNWSFRNKMLNMLRLKKIKKQICPERSWINRSIPIRIRIYIYIYIIYIYIYIYIYIFSYTHVITCSRFPIKWMWWQTESMAKIKSEEWIKNKIGVALQNLLWKQVELMADKSVG